MPGEFDCPSRVLQVRRLPEDPRFLVRTMDAGLESPRLIEGGQSSTRTRRQLAIVRDNLGSHKTSASLRETFDLLTHHIA
jgi:hypothetical protein